MGYSVRSNPVNKHFDIGRGGKTIDTIVIHHAATTDFDGIARTFNGDREASAHYAVGRNNNVDSLVSEANTAWHCGNYAVNQRSIGIENVNDSGAPNWDVGGSTRGTLVELVTDIVRRNPGIGTLEVGRNLFGHKDVSLTSTACPSQLESFLPELANRVNNALANGSSSHNSGKSNEEIADEILAGQWGNNPDRRNRLVDAGYDYNAIQEIVNNRVGNPSSAPRACDETIADQVIAGAWGNGDERRERLQAAGYDYDSIQAIVNQRVDGESTDDTQNLSDDEVANQVLAGAWGNGDDRRNRLVDAGYDYNAIQSIVNQRLGMTSVGRASDDTVANQVINGDWGNGDERRERLQAAGYDYGTVQALVNSKLGL